MIEVFSCRILHRLSGPSSRRRTPNLGKNTRERIPHLTILFVTLPQAFRYHERRLRELSAEYRIREKEQEDKHREEREESRKQFCESLEKLTRRIGNIETKIDKLIA